MGVGSGAGVGGSTGVAVGGGNGVAVGEGRKGIGMDSPQPVMSTASATMRGRTCLRTFANTLVVSAWVSIALPMGPL